MISIARMPSRMTKARSATAQIFGEEEPGVAVNGAHAPKGADPRVAGSMLASHN